MCIRDSPDTEAKEADENSGVHHHRIPEERLLRVRRQHFGHESECRQDEDVDLWVTEDPEQVLPEQRVAAGADVVEVRPEETIELQEDERDRDHGEGEHDQELYD